MVERVSALAGHNQPGHHGDPDRAGVMLQEMPGLVLHQVAVWQDSIAQVGKDLAQLVGAGAAAGPGRGVTGTSGSILRIEPMKWWLFGVEAPELDAELGMTLDLSHSRTHVRVSGDGVSESAFSRRPAGNLVSDGWGSSVGHTSCGLHPVALGTRL
jgi:sarcosine oxidase gamma subunit